MAAPGDESEAFKIAHHNFTSDAQNTQQTNQQIVHKLVADIFDKNSADQSSLQGGKTNPTTTAPSGSSASLPPGLSAASTRGHGRGGRGSRPIEPITIETGNTTSWRSRPPPSSTCRGRGSRGGPPSTRGGYTSSPTSSTFVLGRRGGRNTSYQPITTSYIHPKQPLAPIAAVGVAASKINRVDDEDVPPPGFSGSDNDDCPPPGFTSSDTLLDEGPPPGFEEDDAPPPGFENNNNNLLIRSGSSGGRGGRGGGRGAGVPGSSFSVGLSSRGGRGGGRGSGRGSGIAVVNKTSPPGRGVKILEIPRNRPTSASSSYTNSSSIGAGTRQINYISSSPAIAAPAVMGTSSVPAATTTAMTRQEGFTPALKTGVAQAPIFKEFKPSGLLASLSPNFVDDTSSALRQIAIGGVPALGGGGGGGGTLVPEQPAPLIPPIPSSTIQITPLYPQIGIKSIW